MSPPNSTHFTVQDIPNSGRGIIATQHILQNSPVLESDPPFAHVVFWQYRKEVCARCFHYDRGRKLSVRENAIGKVFCSEECRMGWLGQQGGLGLEAWEGLNSFVQVKSKAISNQHSLPMLAPKPTREDVQTVWSEAEREAETIRQERMSLPKNKAGTEKYYRKSPQRPWTSVIDPDILSFLLSGAISHHHNPQTFHSDVVSLAMDETPYRSTPDLKAHTNSYLQLTAIAPLDLLGNLTAEVCQILVNAGSHNAFGIRSGSEDGDEYLGYGLYPVASYFNHSCRPQIAKRRLGCTWEFRAIRDVEVGEECCITYLGGDEEELTVFGRRERLRQFWGFECMCVRCKEESSG